MLPSDAHGGDNIGPGVHGAHVEQERRHQAHGRKRYAHADDHADSCQQEPLAREQRSQRLPLRWNDAKRIFQGLNSKVRLIEDAEFFELVMIRCEAGLPLRRAI